MEHLNIEILTEQIMPYVGADQFRFVAGVNRTFYSAYTSVYSHPLHRTSYKFINTMELFKFCYLEMRDNEKEQRLLFQCAVKQDNYDALQVLHEIGCSWDVDVITCAQAASFGHLNVLKWAQANGCTWDECECICESAAQGGCLDVLQWARANGCPWNEHTCEMAAAYGHLDVLQWAHANGCPWDVHTCRYAAESGHLDVLHWARANGCPCDED
jgi:hypothetical protein